ncbi:MAG: molybdenum cofactor guanylyltransferase MobA [Flavobacteriaceae bacterium]
MAIEPDHITGQDASLMHDHGRYRSLVVGVVLAGGQSRRMGGGDKSLRVLEGRPMIAHVIERLARQTGAVVISANGDPERFSGFGLPVVADAVGGFAGPLAGVHAGMRWALENAPGARWIATAATDTPFFPEDLVVRLAGANGHHERMIALASSGEREHPVFGLWPVALADDLENALTVQSMRKVLDWVERHPNARARFSGPVIDGIEIDPFFNVNTPEDMETASVVAAALAEEHRA